MNASADLRTRLELERAELAEQFWANEPIESLIEALTRSTDEILIELFERAFTPQMQVALYAVGGYGRGELHPGSDIDLLIVAARPQRDATAIEQFVHSLFDLGLEIGHSVRDVKSCRREARGDITVATAIFERRLICGDSDLVQQVNKTLSGPRLWPAPKFFRAKRDEQIQRHKDNDNIEYNLEPNIKTSPGGLRDIHTALWICARKYGTSDIPTLVEMGVLTPVEAQWLEDGRRFLWWIRYGLHLLAGRKEDHLQFGLQRELAERLGFVDTESQRGVERFMYHYYRHVLALTEVNDIVVQHFEESLMWRGLRKPQVLNEHFELVNNYVQARSNDVFSSHPPALLELFVIMAQRNDIMGVRTDTIRLIRDNLDLIDDEFRADPRNHELFLALLKAPFTIVTQLTRMRRYGILGRYIPEFGKIIGQMQHDLFHIYTVDAHTMAVIRNMRRFRYRGAQEEFPVAYHSVHTIPKLELLYIAGLYHDIAKGRGGDHSTLGAVDAQDFCSRHGLSETDSELVCWLVEQHLYMSSVAQREDIYDPDIVHRFASFVKSEMRLDYLYALTVADINATNPTLWNSWRASLLRHLYNETRKALRRGLESPADKATTVTVTQERALERLADRLLEHDILADSVADEIKLLWADMGSDFFLRHTPPQIAALTETLLQHDLESGPFVKFERAFGGQAAEGATQIYVYTNDQPHLFAATVTVLSKHQLSVVDANVHTSAAGGCFDTYTVLTPSNVILHKDEALQARVTTELMKAIANPSAIKPPGKKRLKRQLKQLPWPTEVKITATPDRRSSTISILASDRPGLLAAIGRMFIELELQILSARITTLGERVEDLFVVQDAQGQRIKAGETRYMLEHTIRQRLDRFLGVRANQDKSS